MNNLMHLRYAIEVEKTNSVSRAAENLYMNQPQLSKAIKELEDSVGIAIFTRTSKGMVPTEKGKEFLIYAKSIVSQLDELSGLFKKNDSERVIFDLSAPRASYISAAFSSFSALVAQKSDVTLNYRETNSLRTVKNVSNGINSLGIIRYKKAHEKYFLSELDERELNHKKVVDFKAYIALSRNHPLAKKEKPLTDADLSDYIEIVHGDTTVPSLPVSEAKQLAELGKRRNVISLYERASQFEILSSVTGTYLRVSPLPKELCERYSLVQKDAKISDGEYTDLLIYKKGYRFTKTDKLFLAELEKCVNDYFNK